MLATDRTGWFCAKICCDTLELYEKYGDFRIAYVGENGEVLRITDNAEKAYSTRDPYAFTAAVRFMIVRMMRKKSGSTGAQ